MSLDKKIEEALEAAVAGAGQSPSLAKKLLAWLSNVASGNEDVHDHQSAHRHLELIYDETTLPGHRGDAADD